MEDIALKWYCNKAKFRKVMSVYDSYNEVIGRIFNSTFELEIKISSIRWTIFLHRNTCDERVDFQYRVFSNGQVISAGSKIFYSGEKSINPIKLEVKDIVNCNLDLFFICQCNRETKKNLEEELFQIEKLQHLSTSLQKIFEKEHMSDIVLKCDSVSLKAHKIILTSQSPVFEAMFMSPMLENKLDTVVIQDMDPTVLQVMVSFMYTGKVKVMNETMACDLLYAAEKYQIEALKEGCLEYLESILSLENAVKILEVSDLLGERLKLHCLCYIKDQFEELKSSKEWRNLKLKNPALALEIYSLDE